MPPPTNLLNKKFGRLTVIERAGTSKGGHALWKCNCDCGTECIKSAQDLVSGSTRSCGCLVKEINHKLHCKHGLSGTKLANTFYGLRARCYNPKDNNYKNYGARGITVCDAWLDDCNTFYEWSKSNGYADNLTLDRIDNNGPYSPDNCRWTTNLEQQSNKRNNHRITFRGETKHISEWCRILGISKSVLLGRLRSGWSEERALTQPVKKYVKRVEGEVTFTYKGKTKTVLQWSEELNINPNTLYKRKEAGWTDEEIITIPKGKGRKDINISHLAKAAGINASTLYYRIVKFGWSEEKALTTPIKNKKEK